MTEEKIRQKIQDKYGDKDYEIINFSICSEPIVIKCNVCNNIIELAQLINLFNPGRKNFCRYCAGTNKGNKFRTKLPLKEAQKRLDENLSEKYTILEDSYCGWARKALIKHSCGKIFKCCPRDLLYHSHCPCIKITSRGETKIKDFLKKEGITFEEQKRLASLRKAPFDFYLPDYNLLIEFQGRQHYEAVEKFGGEKQFLIQKEIDQKKFKIANEEGYNIFYISYKNLNSINEILAQRLTLSVKSNDLK